MAWVTIANPTTATPVSTTTFGIPVAGNMAVLGGAWTAYTPTWGSSGTAPALGNGTLTGRYVQVGKTVDLWLSLTAGSTTTFGTGTWTFTLPVNALNPFELPGMAFDVSVSTTIPLVIYLQTTAASNIANGRCDSATAGAQQRVLSNTQPLTWATGDIAIFNGRYEAA